MRSAPTASTALRPQLPRAALAALVVPVMLAACAKDKEPERTAPPPPSPATSAVASASATPPPPPPAVDASFLSAIAADAGLNRREDDDLASILARLDAPCASQAVSIAQCIAENRACPDCNRAARYLAIGVRQGWAPQYVYRAFQARFDPKEAVTLAVDGSPTQGPASAKVTIVEFGSYLCPHCAAEAPKLDALQKAHPKDVRLVFKPSWSPRDAMQVQATRAALAAAAQGKFWDMHALLFANQPKFDLESIDGYAKSIGLDVAKLHADMDSPAVADQMKRDLMAAAAAKVDSLPSIWINGRAYMTFESLDARIGFELADTK
jgi:protein-disulfide isomerase